jgi:hypothetical protein
MGCGASKGKDEGANTSNEKEVEIKFKHCYVWELDRFFEEVTALMDSFKKATVPFEDARESFYEATKFYEVPGASNYSPF